MRGVRTLFVRVEQQQKTAAAIAAFLSGHPAVSAVHYAGLPGHPGHALAKTQQNGFGAMLSFEIASGVEGVRRFVETTELLTLAESLGGIESLVAHPATMTHASMSVEAGWPPGSTTACCDYRSALENETDLLADIDAGLKAT